MTEAALACVFVHQVQVGVEMDDADGAVDRVVHTSRAGKQQRVVATQQNRHTSTPNGGGHRARTHFQRGHQVVGNDRDVPAVDDQVFAHRVEFTRVERVDLA